MLLHEKVIVITGGASGIGRECALACAREGAHVAVLDVDIGKAEETAHAAGGRSISVVCDVGKESSVQDAVQGMEQHFGCIDAIHNNAGIASPSKALHETSEAEWDRLMTVNLKSVYWTTKFGLAALKKSTGCILNTASEVGLIGQSLHAAYTATKGAMITLTKSMALDYAAFGIRVNAICPAGVWTSALEQWSREQPDPSSIHVYLDQIHALGYCPRGDVIADAAVFLLSHKARFITGCILPVTGGAELGYRR